MEEHINPEILDNFENNCESMEIKKSNTQGVLRNGIENANLQFMSIHSRDQEFIDHTLLGPEYIGNTISNSFIIDLMDDEQNDHSGQPAPDCPITSLSSNESFASEAQLQTILQFVNRHGHVRNQPNTNVENATDHLIHPTEKEIIETELLAMHSNLLNDQNFKLFCNQQIVPIQEGLSAGLNEPPLPSLPASTAHALTPERWQKKDPSYQEPLEEIPELLGSLGATSKKVLPHKKRISRKLKNLETTDSIYQLSPESPPRINRFVLSNGSSHYECELCGSISESQVQFFSHLKGHYEPATVEETESTIKRIPTSIVADVEEPKSKVSRPSSPVVDRDHQVFSEVELNFDNFSEVVELTSQENNHQHPTHSAPDPTDIKILDSNCMDYVVQSQKPTQLVCNVNEEVEFSDTEDMLEGIRGVVDKVSIDDTSNDLDIHQSSWYTNNAFNAITFKEEILINDEFEGRTEPIPMAIHSGDESKTPIHIKEFDNEFNENDNDNGAEGSEQNDLSSVHDNPNLRRRGRPRRVAVKKKPKTSQTDDDETTEDEFAVNVKRTFNCPMCKREFNSANALKYHNYSHTGERPYQCDVCGKSFFAQSALKSHSRVHTGDKPYECDQCNRKFRQWSDMKYHMVSIHSGVKNYTCEFCGKSFARKYSLVIHRRIHTYERDYRCEFCPKSFRASSYLQNHRKIHTGEKPYQCTLCNKKFRVNSDLRRHTKSHERKASTNAKKLEENDENTKTADELLKINYQKESKDDLLFLDKMARKIDHLFKTEEVFVNADDIESPELQFET